VSENPPLESTDANERLTQSITWMWSLGDYAELAPRLEPCAIALCDACAVTPGMAVLDVAAGNGNFAIAAARRGARVTASDLTPRMIELGRRRSAAEGLDITWTQANAEGLPFSAGRFDVVASVFGAQFAMQAERVASELFRVARPGGLVGMANYATAGFLHAMADLLVSLRPSTGAELPSPFQWGDPDEVRRRFAGLATSVDAEARRAAFEFPSLESGWAFWERTNAPWAAVKAMFPPEAYAALTQRALDLMRSLNRADDAGLRLEWDWLLVRARR
jgi:SAM-dependent methyltransferase